MIIRPMRVLHMLATAVACVLLAVAPAAGQAQAAGGDAWTPARTGWG